ncbi:MAG TPA: hypothetical protein VGL56_05870 [Fimbriimonadaceae bacterium]
MSCILVSLFSLLCAQAQISISAAVTDLHEIKSPYQIWMLSAGPDKLQTAMSASNLHLNSFLGRPVDVQRKALLEFTHQSEKHTHSYNLGQEQAEYFPWDYGKVDLISVAEGRGHILYSVINAGFLEAGKPLPSVRFVPGHFPPDSGPQGLGPCLNEKLIAKVRSWVKQGKFDWPPKIAKQR